MGADIFLIGTQGHVYGLVTTIAFFIFGVGALTIWARAGLAAGSRNAAVTAAILCSLGLGSLLLLLAIPALVQIVRFLTEDSEDASSLPNCPGCSKQLLMVRRMGKMQLCDCGWHAPVVELKHLVQEAPAPSTKWLQLVVGPAAIFALILGGAVISKLVISTPAYAAKTAEKAAAKAKADAAEIKDLLAFSEAQTKSESSSKKKN